MSPRLILNYLLAFFVLLSIVIYYLGANGKVNNFPTYLLGLLALYAVFAYQDVRALFVASRILQLSGLLLCYLALSSFWSADFTWLGVGKAFGNVLLLLAFLVGIVVCSKSIDGFDSLLVGLLVLSAGISAIYSIYLDYTIGYQPFHEDRLYALGRLGSPVMSALSYGLAALFTLHLGLAANDRIKQTAGWLLLGLFLYTIFLTGTISVWLGLILAGTVVVALRVRAGLNQTLLMLAAVLGLGMALMAGVYFYSPDVFSSVFPRATSFRPEIWSSAMGRTWAHNPVFGFGHLTSGHVLIGDLDFHHAHSIYLASFYYGGMVGLALLVGLVGWCFWVVGGCVYFGGEGKDWVDVSGFGVALRSANPIYPISSIAAPGLASLVFGCVVFALDGDRVLEKVDLIWIVFWLPVALAARVEISAESNESTNGASV